MTKDRDELYGLHLRGSDRPMPFVNPYRKTGELNEIELLKLERHPLEIADAIIEVKQAEWQISDPVDAEAEAGKGEDVSDIDAVAAEWELLERKVAGTVEPEIVADETAEVSELEIAE